MQQLEDVPGLILEIPDFDFWIDERWHDILLEPTPYLVASAILYLGGVVILAQIFPVLCSISWFFFCFIPWDDEIDSGCF
jgi:hypothetical protein